MNKKLIIKTQILGNDFTSNIKNNIKISEKTLIDMFQLYDYYFFDNNLSLLLNKRNESIIFDIKIRSKQRAGDYSYFPNKNSKNQHRIRVSEKLISSLFMNGEQSIKSNGILIHDHYDAMANVFEHELVHLYFCLNNLNNKIKSGPGKNYYTSHGKLFQKLVLELFGHNDFRHNFFNNKSEKHSKKDSEINKEDCCVGQMISFNYKKEIVKGEIIKLNPKRCKIKVDNIVYNVPYSLLVN